ncbi:MAG: hypothetical protein ACI4WS_07070 [Oscillospiraceae bacterium]
MSSKKQNSNNLPLIATIVVALVAIALAVTAIIMMNKEPAQTQTGNSTTSQAVDTSYLTPEYREECEYAAHDLLDASHEILRLFVTEGLFHEDEPYGNLPEDGYYTVNSTDYTSLEQIEELVRSVYIEDAAQQIMKNSDGKGLAVYANREQLVRVEQPDTTAETTADSQTEESGTKYETVYKLGISADFQPDEAKSWSSCAITIDYLEEGRCGLTVYLDGVDSSNGITDENRGSVLEMTMIKLDDGWRLAEFVTRSAD